MRGKHIVLGLTNSVTILGKSGRKVVRAKIDTGATKSSIDTRMAAELHLGPVIRSKMIKSAHGSKVRPIIMAKIKMNGKTLHEEFTLADRAHMKYKVLIGQNILKKGFIIDPSRK